MVTKPTDPKLIITTTPYPKWWKNAKAWNINIVSTGYHVVIPKSPGYKIYVSTIVFTVDGETNIRLGMGPFGSSGDMDLGGTNEPRGMVIAMGNSPLPCGEGPFEVYSTNPTVHVGGFVSFFYEKE